jgi:hypothetical protein
MAVKTFRLISPVQGLERRDFTLADSTLLNPNNANPLEMGEFLELDANYQLIRGTGSALAFALFTEKGRSDTQALGKALVLFLGSYEAETLIFNTSSSPALGADLEVATVTYDSLNKSGLQTKAGGLSIGRVTRTSASNGGYLRFIQTQA